MSINRICNNDYTRFIYVWIVYENIKKKSPLAWTWQYRAQEPFQYDYYTPKKPFRRESTSLYRTGCFDMLRQSGRSSLFVLRGDTCIQCQKVPVPCKNLIQSVLLQKTATPILFTGIGKIGSSLTMEYIIRWVGSFSSTFSQPVYRSSTSHDYPTRERSGNPDLAPAIVNPATQTSLPHQAQSCWEDNISCSNGQMETHHPSIYKSTPRCYSHLPTWDHPSLASRIGS